MAKRRVGVEYSPSMLERVRPGAVLPDRALCLPTFSHFLIVNKTSLSLSLSLSLWSSAPTTILACMNVEIPKTTIATRDARSLVTSRGLPLAAPVPRLIPTRLGVRHDEGMSA